MALPLAAAIGIPVGAKLIDALLQGIGIWKQGQENEETRKFNMQLWERAEAKEETRYQDQTAWREKMFEEESRRYGTTLAESRKQARQAKIERGKARKRSDAATFLGNFNNLLNQNMGLRNRLKTTFT